MLNNRYSNKLQIGNVKYFKSQAICYAPLLPINHQNIKTFLSINTNIEIIETKLIKSAKGVSNEGQRLSGYQILIHYRIHELFKYVGNNKSQTVHMAELAPLNTCIIINIPEEINKKDIESIYHSKLFMIDSLIEKIYVNIINERIIMQNIFVFFSIRFKEN